MNLTTENWMPLIPLDKSWFMRLGFLDLYHGYNRVQDHLQQLVEDDYPLSDDLRALRRARIQWDSDLDIDVGESGTLFRFLQFLAWKEKTNRNFIKRGTLIERSITDDPSIVDWSLKQLLELDHGTSQWASAAMMTGTEYSDFGIWDMPPKLRLTHWVSAHWQSRTEHGQPLDFAYHDLVLVAQVKGLLAHLSGKTVKVWQTAESYCFARVFEQITAAEGAKKWPNLLGHETNRIKEMEQAVKELNDFHGCISKDHRVVQAIAMYAVANDIDVVFGWPEVVKKSWPQFWDFITLVKNNK